MSTTRPMEPDDIPALADIWHEGWHGSHVGLVPEGLVLLRTRPDFERRLRAMPGPVIVSGPIGAPTGFVALRENELYQAYVAPAARGTSVATELMRAGEAALKGAGHDEIELDCVDGNHRAIGFYTKMGWQNRGVRTAHVDTSDGKFALQVIVFKKTL